MACLNNIPLCGIEHERLETGSLWGTEGRIGRLLLVDIQNEVFGFVRQPGQAAIDVPGLERFDDAVLSCGAFLVANNFYGGIRR